MGLALPFRRTSVRPGRITHGDCLPLGSFVPKSRKYTAPTAWAARLNAAAGHQLSGDQIALNFVGALTDNHQWRVAEVALDVVFGGIAVATMDPHRVQGDLHGDL